MRRDHRILKPRRGEARALDEGRNGRYDRGREELSAKVVRDALLNQRFVPFAGDPGYDQPAVVCRTV